MRACAVSRGRKIWRVDKVRQDIHRFDFSGSKAREQNVFTAQMTPLFIRSDVVNKLQACFPQNKLSSAPYKIHWSQCAGVWETSPKGLSAKCETRKTRYIAAHIKFKAFMFAYRTSTGSAPLYLNSVLQTYVPREACVLQVNDALLFIPKRHKITFTDFYMNCSHLVTCTTQSKLSPQPSSRISSIFIWPSNSSNLYSNSIL